MGILFGERPRLTGVHGLTDIESYGLSFVGNGQQKLEIFSDIQVPLEEIRRDIIANQPPSPIKFIMDYS